VKGHPKKLGDSELSALPCQFLFGTFLAHLITDAPSDGRTNQSNEELLFIEIHGGTSISMAPFTIEGGSG
jgi:hypothetical protein